MYWYGQFKSGFFREWTKAGLPPAENYESKYTEALRAIQFVRESAYIVGPQNDPLNPAILNTVYGFGILFGRICGALLGLSTQVTEERSEWCGRFNLGISLFDYVCDESQRAKTVVQLPAFSPFFKQVSSTGDTFQPTDPAEKLLNEIASTVIAELEEALVLANSLRRPGGLWQALQEMFEAELTVVDTQLHPHADIAQLGIALRLKSREPFRVMAEWMAYGNTRLDKQTLFTQSRKLGRALGQCYWLMDDAKDVWIDLNTGTWNLFLMHSMAVEPSLYTRKRDAIVDLRLMQIWERDDLIKRLSRSAVRQVVKSLLSFDDSVSQHEDALGLMAASLARW